MKRATLLLAIITTGWMGVAACASQPAPPPKASGSATTAPSTSISTTTAATTPTSTPTCVGLSICPPPPPDAEGNPACYYADGWRATTPGPGIEVWYFHEPQNMSKPDEITATVREKDGTNDSQIAKIDAGQQVHRFEFPGVDAANVQEVLLSSSTGRCFVIGPGS